MTLSLPAETAPLHVNRDGVALVGGTRIRLETVIAAFLHGDSPEQIADSFDALSLADIYGVLAYYLKHRDEVEAYLTQQAAGAAAVQREIEMQRPEMFSLRARLLAKKKQA